MIAEPLAEDVDAAGVLRAVIDADAQADRVVLAEARACSISTFETCALSTNEPRSEMRQVTSRPYCEPASFHQRGV